MAWTAFFMGMFRDIFTVHKSLLEFIVLDIINATFLFILLFLNEFPFHLIFLPSATSTCRVHVHGGPSALQAPTNSGEDLCSPKIFVSAGSAHDKKSAILHSKSMAADSSSSLTSTSHTLTAGSSNMADDSASGPAAALLQSLQTGHRHAFLQPTADLPTGSLNLVRDTLEAFAAQVGDEQQRRLKESRKRKRGGEKEDVLKLRKIYVDGFETNQVWQQAKKVIGGVLQFSETLLGEMEEKNEIGILDGDITGDVSASAEEDDEELSDLDAESAEDDEDDDEDPEDLGSEVELEDLEDGEGLEGSDAEEDMEELGEGEDEEDEEDDDNESYVEDADGLNDGFFSLDDFNKQTQWFEEQDTRGDPNTDMGSDEEDIDWNADPNAPAKKPKTSKGKSNRDADEDMADESDDEDDGPTFGDMALDAPEGDSDDEAAMFEDGLGEDEEENNANDVFYKDFFAPPPRKRDNNRPPRKPKAPKTQEPTEEDMERAMADVRRDLFDDESDAEGLSDDDALSDVSAGDPKSRKSAHERRQAKLAAEIRQLEAASVAKRAWTLSGEANAVDRPTNSLLEQDLDFEYVGKPVPVITPEVSEGIDELIKRRILSQEFDEVLKRRPETDALPSNTRRGLVDVQDSKSDKSLAQLYEEEHVKNADPDNYVSQSDEKLQREEKEVENMWKEVSAKLDALSSWHYKPKPTSASLSVVADVATIAMEDAQPATAQGVAGESSRMAPQEVYKAGKDNAAAGEVVSKSGLPVARQEMSREDKARRRRQQKERIRKAGAGSGAAGGSRAATSKKAQTMADLKKGGVKVINRKGEITDVDGKKVKAAKTMSSGSFKL